MSVEQVEASFVLLDQELLKSTDQKSDFRQRSALEAVVEPTVIVPSSGSGLAAAEGHKITFPRERITVLLSDVRSAVTMGFPNGDDDLRKMSDIIESAIALTELPAGARWSFGFNASIVHAQSTGDTAATYISRRLIDQRLFDAVGAEVTGATVNVVAGSDARPQWNLRLEPRFNDQETARVFMALNHHFEESALPDSAGDVFEYLHGTAIHMRELVRCMDALS